MTTHTIPTTKSDGEIRSGTILIIDGASRAGGPGGWAVGGWDETTENRVEHGGPMVPGPQAYAFGRCGVIDNHGGTAREHQEANEAGRLIRCADGDTLTIDGVDYTLTVDRRGYPHLTVA